MYKRAATSLSEARNYGITTVFLCHSHKDSDLVGGLITMLGENGWRVYVDWRDNDMPSSPTKETAELIQGKIKALDYFLFLATPNSLSSRWCPWEIGYADGNKENSRILVVPTTDQTGQWYGSEYLQLYRHMDFSTLGTLAVWYPGETTNGVIAKNL